VDAARALLDQLRTEPAVEENVVAPPEMRSVPYPRAHRPLPPPVPDPLDAPVPPAPPDSRDFEVGHYTPVCAHCGATVSMASRWCERCLTRI
jgi:hypothetical protein